MPNSIIQHEEEHLYADDPDTAVGKELMAALLRLRRAQRTQEVRVGAVSGLADLDLRAIRYIVQADRDERQIGPKALVSMLGTSAASVTNIVDRLVAKGFVERTVHPRDRRAHYLSPTPRAIEQVNSMIGDHHARMVAAVNALDDDSVAAAVRAVSAVADELGLLAAQQREHAQATGATISPGAAAAP